ncbi:MAG: putative metal-binding motif-containing protein [Deltaproteobacteria bacterium]|nr:putative metal-binding motif-containing protein [Deltaproteobacteria bacterium]
MPRHLSLLLLAPALLFLGCVDTLQPCDFDGLTGSVGNCALPEGDCFMDLDEDGIAARYPNETRSPGVECDDEDSVTEGQYGDCDDTDDNNFPGNPEVCDGLDNDCSGLPNFDVEEAELDTDTGRPRCAAGARVQVFLRGGGSLAGADLSARSSSLEIDPGTPLTGELRLRAFFSLDGEAELSAVAVASWEDPENYDEEHPILISDPFGGAPAEIDIDCEPFEERGYCDISVTSFGGLSAPAAGAERTEYLTIAAATETGAPHLAALSSPNYCCEGPDCQSGGPQEGPPCDEVYAHQVEFEGDIITDGDLRDLTELDLGGCSSFGAARVQELAEAYGGSDGPPGGPPERCSVIESEDCLPFYRPKPIGCQIIPITFEGTEEAKR